MNETCSEHAPFSDFWWSNAKNGHFRTLFSVVSDTAKCQKMVARYLDSRMEHLTGKTCGKPKSRSETSKFSPCWDTDEIRISQNSMLNCNSSKDSPWVDVPRGKSPQKICACTSVILKTMSKLLLELHHSTAWIRKTTPLSLEALTAFHEQRPGVHASGAPVYDS